MNAKKMAVAAGVAAMRPRRTVKTEIMLAVICLASSVGAAAVWPVSPSVLARTGQQSAGGGLIQDIHSSSINDRGQIAYSASVTGAPGTEGLFLRDGGVTSLRSLSSQAYSSLSMNSLSQIAYNKGGSVFLNSGGSDALCMDGGPGISFGAPSLNDNGVVLSVDRGTNQRIILQESGSNRVLAWEYMSFPGIGTQAGRGFINVNSSQAIADSGDYVFCSEYDREGGGGRRTGVILGQDPGFTLIAQDDFLTTSLFGEAMINNVGQIVFLAVPGSGQWKIYRQSNGTASVAIQPGMALDAALGAQYQAYVNYRDGQNNIVLNDAGDIAFEYVDSGGTFQNRVGIAVLRGDTIWRIAREGEEVPGLPGVTLTSEFRSLDMNDRGELVFVNTLSDGTVGVFLVVPEPACAGLLAISCILLRRSRRLGGSR